MIPGNQSVHLELPVELIQITDIIDRFLKFTDKTGSKRTEFHIAPVQLTGDKKMVRGQCRTAGLIDTDFQIKFLASGRFEMLMNFGGEIQSRRVHHRTAFGGQFINFHAYVIGEHELLTGIIAGNHLLLCGREPVKCFVDSRRIPITGRRIHHIGKIKRDHRHSGGQSGVDIGKRFKMVAIGSVSITVISGKHQETGIIHHLAEGTFGHGQLTDGLLGKHRRNLNFFCRTHMADCRQSQAVTATDSSADIAQTFRRTPREIPAQSGGIGF